jgi:sugar fermentation stimulation protein A
MTSQEGHTAVEYIPSSPGVYVLSMELEVEVELKAGALPLRRFRPGYYAYVGSAMGGLRGRIRRHITGPRARPRWHVDYLLQVASPMLILWGETQRSLECAVASALAGVAEGVAGFGSSDCGCSSHLFFAAIHPERVLKVPMTLLEKEGVVPHITSVRDIGSQHCPPR